MSLKRLRRGSKNNKIKLEKKIEIFCEKFWNNQTFHFAQKGGLQSKVSLKRLHLKLYFTYVIQILLSHFFRIFSKTRHFTKFVFRENATNEKPIFRSKHKGQVSLMTSQNLKLIGSTIGCFPCSKVSRFKCPTLYCVRSPVSKGRVRSLQWVFCPCPWRTPWRSSSRGSRSSPWQSASPPRWRYLRRSRLDILTMCVLQVRDIVVKYFDRKTAVSRDDISHEGVRLNLHKKLLGKQVAKTLQFCSDFEYMLALDEIVFYADPPSLRHRVLPFHLLCQPR